MTKTTSCKIEIFCEIKIKDSPMVEMNILRSPKKEEFTRIIFYPNRGYRDWDRYDKWEPKSRLEASSGLISIDSSYSSTLPSVLSRSPETGPVFLEPNENLRINVFIDKLDTTDESSIPTFVIKILDPLPNNISKLDRFLIWSILFLGKFFFKGIYVIPISIHENIAKMYL